MRLLGICLGVLRRFGMNVPTRRRFMERYTTTIGKTIYCSSKWPKEDTNELVVHELCHILQFTERWMALKYLFSKTSRMHYEAECVLAEILCFPNKRRGKQWWNNRIQQFVGYGIPEKTVRREFTMLQNGRERKNAKRVYEAFTRWRGDA
jgi:hypothetical protein